MSSELPERPNLDHLKKQAKHRLIKLRQRAPGARLADAQHALARKYGFQSWAALKAHVESLAHNYRFDRYTPEARRVLFFSRDEACKRGSPMIEPEHIVLGLAREGHVTPERVRSRIRLSGRRFEILAPECDPVQLGDARRAQTRCSSRQSRRCHHRHPASERSPAVDRPQATAD